VSGHVPAGQFPEQEGRREDAEAKRSSGPQEQKQLAELVEAAKGVGTHLFLKAEG
jgi:hypothetical protein